MVKRTFKQLREFTNTWTDMCVQNPDIDKTKFGYAVARFSEKNLPKIFKEYNTEVQNINIEHALTHKDTGAILYNETRHTNKGREFQFSPENLKKVLAKERSINDIWDVKEFDVQPWECKDMTGVDLSDLERDVFDGLIINIAPEPKKEEAAAPEKK